MFENLPLWAISGLSALGGPILAYIVAMFIPNTTVFRVCKVAGKAMSLFGRQKIGKTWEKGEHYFQGTLAAALAGLNAGLDEDD